MFMFLLSIYILINKLIVIKYYIHVYLIFINFINNKISKE